MFNFHCQLNPNAPKIKKFKNPETFDFEGELGFNYENNLVKWAQISFQFDEIFHRKVQIPILVLMAKFVKLCLHLSYIAQISFHFDEILGNIETLLPL